LSHDLRGIPLQEVGVRGLELPLLIQGSGAVLREVPAIWQASVSLAAELRGTHMSRFVEVLSKYGRSELRNLDFSDLLIELRRKLQCSRAEIRLSFSHFIEKQAPVSRVSSPAAVKLQITAFSSEEDSDAKHSLFLEIPASNLCPCSKAISDQGAHNQRVYLRLSANLLDAASWSFSRLDALIERIEESASCRVFPFLKRSDEKFVTEQQFSNAKFVEDIIRDAVLRLRKEELICGFCFEVEALESIHAHNAWARHSEDFEPGFRT
jgi:GTP cyclohydrolase I